MNRTNQFFDKILQNFDKVSDIEKKKVFKRLTTLLYSQNMIIENLEEGIIAIDNKGIIQEINKKACFLFSIPRNSEGKSLSKYMHNNNIGKSILEFISINDSETKKTCRILDKDSARFLFRAIHMK